MRLYYHILKMSEMLAGTAEGKERVQTEWQRFPKTVKYPPRVGETITIGQIDSEHVVLLKVISVHWEIFAENKNLGAPGTHRCLITLTEEDDVEEATEQTREEILAEFKKA